MTHREVAFLILRTVVIAILLATVARCLGDIIPIGDAVMFVDHFDP